MNLSSYFASVERIIQRRLSEAERGIVEDCFNAAWDVDRTVAFLNIVSSV